MHEVGLAPHGVDRGLEIEQRGPRRRRLRVLPPQRELRRERDELQTALSRGGDAEAEREWLQAQLAAIRAQDSEAAADSSSSDEQRLRTLAQEEAELQQAMAMMQTLKARQEQLERELRRLRILRAARRSRARGHR